MIQRWLAWPLSKDYRHIYEIFYTKKRKLDQNMRLSFIPPISVRVVRLHCRNISWFNCRKLELDENSKDCINMHVLSNHIFECITVPGSIKGRSFGRADQVNPVQRASHTAKSPQLSAQDHPV